MTITITADITVGWNNLMVWLQNKLFLIWNYDLVHTLNSEL